MLQMLRLAEAVLKIHLLHATNVAPRRGYVDYRQYAVLLIYSYFFKISVTCPLHPSRYALIRRKRRKRTPPLATPNAAQTLRS